MEHKIFTNLPSTSKKFKLKMYIFLILLLNLLLDFIYKN